MLMVTAFVAHAHFVFVVPEPGGVGAKVFIGETLQPDSQVDAKLLSGTKLSLRSGGRETPLELIQGSDAYTVRLNGTGTRLIHGVADLGFTAEGSAEAKPYLLMYHPKTILGDPFDESLTLGRETPVELVPLGRSGSVKLELLARGKPVANSEITVLLPDGSQRKLKTDAAGQTETLAQYGRFGAWARVWEPASARDGKHYHEIRHYATLVFDAAVDGTVAAAVSFATMPEAVASFGAVVSGGWLYIYGGHVSPTHSYSTDAVSGKLFRMNLGAPGKWEELPGGPGLQGMNLATYAGKIYRIGGMMPHNPPGQAADNFSVADCARFDPGSQMWEALPPMPEPRSSHDVVVIGDQLIVTGGWDMEGAASQHWAETMLTLDLSAPKLEWKSLPQPFRRRALIAAVYKGRMFVMGGITDLDRVVGDVDIYDPRTKVWTNGPALPGSGVNPFGPAAAVDAGSLYVSVADGTLYRLDPSEQNWEKVGRGTPRVAHRAVADGQSILVMGGADKGKDLDLIEAIPVNQVR
jgi:hypothetical protein